METKTSFWLSTRGLAALGLIGAASYFLFVEHRQHIIEILPFLILLACPLMHLMMHRGHCQHEHDGHHTNASEEAYKKGLEEGRQQGIEHQHAVANNDDFSKG